MGVLLPLAPPFSSHRLHACSCNRPSSQLPPTLPAGPAASGTLLGCWLLSGYPCCSWPCGQSLSSWLHWSRLPCSAAPAVLAAPKGQALSMPCLLALLLLGYFSATGHQAATRAAASLMGALRHHAALGCPAVLLLPGTG